MTVAERKEFQRTLNAFTSEWLKGVPRLFVDGEFGHATNTRVRTVEYYLGLDRGRIHTLGDAYRAHPQVQRELVRRMRHPMDPQYVPARAEAVRKSVVYRGRTRRRTEKRRYYAHRVKAFFTPGVTTYDGRPVAKWLVPYLDYARRRGWLGRLASGWRDPVYSEHLCFVMCGQPSCAGRCAGRSSNHSGSANPRGALDVTDYVRFGQIMHEMPLPSGAPRLFNALPNDPVHYSASGR